jgi:hypothetical protein
MDLTFTWKDEHTFTWLGWVAAISKQDCERMDALRVLEYVISKSMVSGGFLPLSTHSTERALIFI